MVRNRWHWFRLVYPIDQGHLFSKKDTYGQAAQQESARSSPKMPEPAEVSKRKVPQLGALLYSFGLLGSPTKLDGEKGTLIRTSLLEDLDYKFRGREPEPCAQDSTF